MTRTFARAPIDVDRVVELAELARRAPSAGFSQGTHFLVLDGEALEQFWTVGPGDWFVRTQPGVLRAPVVVLALGDPGAYSARYGAADKSGHGLDEVAGWDVPFWVADTAMAVQQLLLLCEDRGLGALWFGVFRQRAEVGRAFGIPDDVVIVGAVAIGVRDDADAPSGSPRHRARRTSDEVIHRGRWLR